MPKKLTYEFVKGEFEKRGYNLLTDSYTNSTTKLDYICPNGHTHSINWKEFRRGHGCPYCAGKIQPIIDEIRKSFEVEGYTLLSTVYVNNKTKLRYRCPKGHEYSINWNNWNAGYRCYFCNGNMPDTLQVVRESFEREGYILLNDVYRNSRQCLFYICPEGHEGKTNWHHWKRGVRCKECFYINNSGSKHYNWKGGKSFEEYCAVWKDKDYKQDIRERDGNRCLNPYCYSKSPEDLTIHHINYDKKDCHPKNLITVCRSCNSRANTDRKWHKAWYHAIMYRRAQ